MASRQTRVIGGNGTDTQSFTLDPGLLQYVQSVFVEVDNTAGGAIQPTLSVKTNNGQTLAKQQQGRSISAGGVGSATWALRLADETEPATDPFLPLLSVYVTMTGGQIIANNTLASVIFTSVKYNNGGWINLGIDPTLLTVPTTGYYTVWAQFEWNNAAAAGQRREAQLNLAGDPFLNGAVARENVPTINGIPTSQQISITRRFAAGSTFHAIAFQTSGGNFTLGSCHLAITRVWKG